MKGERTPDIKKIGFNVKRIRKTVKGKHIPARAQENYGREDFETQIQSRKLAEVRYQTHEIIVNCKDLENITTNG